MPGCSGVAVGCGCHGAGCHGDYGSQSLSWCYAAMRMTTVRMVQSTVAATPTASEMKAKFRASREATSACARSPRATAVRT